MTHHLETEFKLRATAPIDIADVDRIVQELGVTCRRQDVVEQTDDYLDADGELRVAGRALRIRRNRHGAAAGCKSAGEHQDGLYRREEVEEPWSGPDLPTTAADLPGPVRDAIEPFTHDRRLTPWLQLRVQRQLRELEVDGRPLGELVLDRVVVGSGAEAPTFVEIELEVHDDLAACEHLATVLQQRLDLQAADDDKPAHAWQLLHAADGAADDDAMLPAPIDPWSQALQHWLLAMRASEVLVRADDRPEALHALRVAIRRLRVLVRSFASAWPEGAARELLDLLAAAGRRLGPWRDLDVTLAALPAAAATLPPGMHAGTAWLGDWLRANRAQTRSEVLAWFRSVEHQQLQRRIGSLVRTAMVPVDAEERNRRTDERLRRSVRTVRQLSAALPPDLPIAPLHQLRLAVKRLRYLAEEFAGTRDRAFRRALRRIFRLQQRLGDVCDHERAIDQHLAWITALPPDTPRDQVVATIGGLVALHATGAAEARQRLQRLWHRIDKKRTWRALRRN